MFGRQAQLPVDLLYKTSKTQKVTSSEYAADLKQSLEKAYNKVRTTMGAKQLLQRRLYDRRVHGQPYQVGDHVWLHTSVLARGNTKKLHHPWKGPYCVVKRLTDSTYRVQSLSNPRERAVQQPPQSSLVPLIPSVSHQVMTVSRRIHHRQYPLVHTWRSLRQWILTRRSSNFHHPWHWYHLCLVVGIQPAVNSHQIILVSLSQSEIVCRLQDVFFQRGELCNIV